MRKQQCRTQISFILCQLWIGAEEANSLESYKKKVSEIIKHPAAGLSAHSQPETGWKPLVKFLSDPQSISILRDLLLRSFPSTLGSLCFQITVSMAVILLNIWFSGTKTWPHHYAWTLPGRTLLTDICHFCCTNLRAKFRLFKWFGVFSPLFYGISVFFFKDAHLYLE